MHVYGHAHGQPVGAVSLHPGNTSVATIHNYIRWMRNLKFSSI